LETEISDLGNRAAYHRLAHLGRLHEFLVSLMRTDKLIIGTCVFFALIGLIGSTFLGPNAFWMVPLAFVGICLLFWIPAAGFELAIGFIKWLIAKNNLEQDLEQLKNNRIIQTVLGIIGAIIAVAFVLNFVG
jgi:magnesium-transporting ATPase (P-type)